MREVKEDIGFEFLTKFINVSFERSDFNNTINLQVYGVVYSDWEHRIWA